MNVQFPRVVQHEVAKKTLQEVWFHRNGSSIVQEFAGCFTKSAIAS